MSCRAASSAWAVGIDEPTGPAVRSGRAALTRPDTQALGDARILLSQVEAALKTLKKYGPKQKGGLFVKRPVISPGRTSSTSRPISGPGDRPATELERRFPHGTRSRASLNPRSLALVPWLELNLPLETASTKDVVVLFGTVAAGVDLDALEGALLAEMSWCRCSGPGLTRS